MSPETFKGLHPSLPLPAHLRETETTKVYAAVASMQPGTHVIWGVLARACNVCWVLAREDAELKPVVEKWSLALAACRERVKLGAEYRLTPEEYQQVKGLIATYDDLLKTATVKVLKQAVEKVMRGEARVRKSGKTRTDW